MEKLIVVAVACFLMWWFLKKNPEAKINIEGQEVKAGDCAVELVNGKCRVTYTGQTVGK